ncbi:MAG: hypothetical protein N0E44_02880 [Candidatus Thiodiazotropha lotti]|nr:hypothetical protein [Candidatus Thiodiazotropha lotti]MCW4218820.1 hypothetical protein [Candidatus Thiodiazotropha lotti]
MSKKLVILVHGMGNHPKGSMIKEFKKALSDRAKAFGIIEQSYFSKADHKEFNYSEYFDLLRKQFADNAEARKKGFKYLTGKGFEEKLLLQLTNFESKLSKDEFFYTHWLDVVLYSTMYFGEKIRLDFIDFFDKQRKKYGHSNIHLISHSLGTAVAHDSLAKYYRTESDPFDNIPDLKTGDFNIASIWTFANVTRMVNRLNNLTDPIQSTVVTGTDGCSSNFANIRHKYDPFTWFLTYNRRMSNYYSVVPTLIRNVNTHDFYEYITEPRVARAMLNLIYEQSITDTQFEKGVSEHKEGTLKEEAKELRDLLKSIWEKPSLDSVKDVVKQFKTIQKKIDELSGINE